MKDDLLVATAISKKFGNTIALNDVSLRIPQAQVYALLGKNGAGKSTLIAILAGARMPDAGHVHIRGTALEGTGVQRITCAQSLGIRVVYQELSVINYLSVIDNIFLGTWYSKCGVIDKKKAELEIQAIFEELELHVDPHELLVNLPQPKRQLVEICKALIQKPKLLILDEPTSSLGMHEVEILFKMIRKIKENKSSVIYVSHRMSEIREIADVVGIMRDGKLVSECKQKQVSIEDVVRFMLGEKPPLTALPHKEKIQMRQEPVLTVANIRIHPKVDNVSFTLYRGEVLGIAGLLGSGRTEVLEAIAGLRKTEQGSIQLVQGSDSMDITNYGFLRTKRHKIGFVSEDRKQCGILPNLSIEENIVMTNMARVSTSSVIRKGKITCAAKRIAAHMEVKLQSTKDSILSLSGGNQQKVVISKWFYADSKVLLLDEPTRGVDIASKTHIYARVRDWVKETQGSVVVVSSEIEELPLLCDRIVVLHNGRIKSPQPPCNDADALVKYILKEG